MPKKKSNLLTAVFWVCAGTGCVASGSEKIYEKMKELCQEMPGVSVEFQKDVPHLGAIKTGCQGICELGPLVRIEPLHYQYVKVTEKDCMEIFQRTVLNHEPVEHLFYKKGGEVLRFTGRNSIYCQANRIVLTRGYKFTYDG